MVKGYAIKFDGQIDVSTVSPTERGAKVNWLVVFEGITPTNGWDDERIDKVFADTAYMSGAQLIEVTITE